MNKPLFENIKNRYGIYQDLFESEITPAKLAKEIAEKTKNKNILKKTATYLKKLTSKTVHGVEHGAHTAHEVHETNKD